MSNRGVARTTTRRETFDTKECYIEAHLPSAFCLLPSAFCLLPSAFCLLLTAHCSPLTAHRSPLHEFFNQINRRTCGIGTGECAHCLLHFRDSLGRRHQGSDFLGQPLTG